MRIGICSGFLAATLLMAGVAAASVSVDYDLRVDFSKYKTYSWKHIQTVDQLWDQQVKAAIEGQLAATGLTQVPSGGDVLVSAIVVTRPKQVLTGTFSGFPSAPWAGSSAYYGGFGRVYVRGDRLDVGTLIVEMIDGTSDVLVLRALATDAASSRPEPNRKKLDSEVRKMFKHFPLRADSR